MSDIVIRVENLSKRYVIKHANRGTSGDGLRHAIQDAVSAPFRRVKPKFERRKEKNTDPISTSDFSLSTSSSEDFYALKDVSFEVRRGEVLGIIGRNGAGKSTLLKILSRITEPTSGRIGIKGRVASLLEVGTGFHPELTGRENIFLNGAILGMTREEVRTKFDEIVDFSGVERFLDTPVKRYSSGMYVRLAFAVAAHLEPEILIVDEVLAVGDAEFQGKCLGKMKSVSGNGRTVLFVSHNLSAVQALCGRCLLLSQGLVQDDGFAETVTKAYSSYARTASNSWVPSLINGAPLQITQVRLTDQDGNPTTVFSPNQDMCVLLTYEVRRDLSAALIEIYVMAPDNAHLITLGEDDSAGFSRRRTPGVYSFRVVIPARLLNVGMYEIHINSAVGGVGTLDHTPTVSFCIRDSSAHPALLNRRGYLVPKWEWTSIAPECVSIV